MSCTLIPVLKLNTIIRDFPFIEDGLKEVLKYTNGDQTIQDIYNQLIDGSLSLSVVYNDKEYVGFVTTKIAQPIMGERIMYIVHTYLKPKSGVFFDGLHLLEAQAKGMGCKTVRFYTLRKELFDKRLIDEGWKNGYIEFIKEI